MYSLMCLEPHRAPLAWSGEERGDLDGEEEMISDEEGQEVDGEDEEDGEEEEEDGHKDEGLKEETNKEDMGGEEEEEVNSDEDRVTVRDLEVLPLMHLKEWEVVDDSITFPSCDISSELKVSFHISSTLFNFSCSLPSYIPSLPYYTVPSLPPSFIPYSSPLPSPPLPSPPLPSPPLPSPPLPSPPLPSLPPCRRGT